MYSLNLKKVKKILIQCSLEEYASCQIPIPFVNIYKYYLKVNKN